MIKSDFDIIVHKIPTKKELHLHAVGDLHAGSIEANLKGWERFNDIILSDPQAYVIFLGDLMNNATKSSVSNCFEEIMRPRDQKIYLKEKLADLAKSGKILAMVPGNHENRSLKDADDNPLYDVAAKLDLEDVYRENLALVKIVLDNGGRNPCMYSVLASHGAGGGMLTGSSVNHYERFASYWNGVDIFCFGHSHKPFVTKPNKIELDLAHDRVRKKSTVLMTVPSWLDYAGYSLRGLMSPVEDAKPDQPMGLVLSAKPTDREIKIVW